jgi:tetratricopeptide (TPR) repeat protein
MKKRTIYLLATVVFILAVIGVVVKYKGKEEEKANMEYALLERKGPSAASKEWMAVKQKYNGLIEQLRINPDDTKPALQLASLFIQEARENGNYMYYDKAAMRYINTVLQNDPQNFEGLVFKSLIYMSQHHFADGIATARQAAQVNPYNAYIYGLMVDGNVEMGNYDTAVSFADKMVSIRPDLTSYSRISYLREIFGNYPAAIEAMRMAVESGGMGDEHTEWTRVQLASLYEKTGDFKRADSLYNFSLAVRPGYPYALAGLGRVAVANKEYDKAIAYYLQADSLTSDNTIKEELADAYQAKGNAEKANAILRGVIDELAADAKAGENDETIGHYADRELAYDYLKIGEKDAALKHALLEYNRRPDNIDVNETVAWVYYGRGEYGKALPYLKVALRTNSKNPVLLSRAALIYDKAGDKPMAKQILSQTAMNNPYIGQQLMQDTKNIFATL